MEIRNDGAYIYIFGLSDYALAQYGNYKKKKEFIAQNRTYSAN